MKPRVVFDCMVYLQSATKPRGPAAACFQLVESGSAELCVSPEVLAETKEVLARPELRRKFKRLSAEIVEGFMGNVEGKATLIQGIAPVFTGLRDPDDEPYLNLALAANAAYLVTRDNDLLDLMNDPDFRQRFPGLTILDPVAFLRALSPSPATDQSLGGPTSDDEGVAPA